MSQEDYPYCVYCDAKVSFAQFDTQSQSIMFYCECGEIVEVGIGLEDGERLLSDSGCAEGC